MNPLAFITEHAAEMLTHPLATESWKKSQQETIAALWSVHHGLRDGPVSGLLDDARRVASRSGLPVELLDAQTQAVRDLTFENLEAPGGQQKFFDRYVASHGELLARSADSFHSWQQAPVRSMSIAHLQLESLLSMHQEPRLYLLGIDERNWGPTAAAWTNARDSETLEKLVWKQLVRIKDHLVQCKKLGDELPKPLHRSFGRWWDRAQAIIEEIEKQDYDLWSEPIRLRRSRSLADTLHSVVPKFGKRKT